MRLYCGIGYYKEEGHWILQRRRALDTTKKKGSHQKLIHLSNLCQESHVPSTFGMRVVTLKVLA
jgi:hypothetical protein